MTPEEASLSAYLFEHWGRIATGVCVIFGVVYRAGHEHQRYSSLQRRVKELEDNREDDLSQASTMNANLCRIMGHLGIQPVEGTRHRRSDD